MITVSELRIPSDPRDLSPSEWLAVRDLIEREVAYGSIQLTMEMSRKNEIGQLLFELAARNIRLRSALDKIARRYSIKG